MNVILAKHASREFNLSLWNSVQLIAADVEDALKDNLVALILGGGYGRGEGGVWVTETGEEERPYNDLDFTIVVSDAGSDSLQSLAKISATHTNLLGVDVDFSRPLTLRQVQNLPHILMWHDLLLGHIMISGPSDFLVINAPQSLRAPLPKVEAARLLLNRGAGLLRAILEQLGIESGQDADFRRRNLQKLNLSLGDAVLILHSRYTAYRGEREAALVEAFRHTEYPFKHEVMVRYQEALQFKYHPASLPVEQPGMQELTTAADLFKKVLLAVESERLGICFADIDGYVSWTGIREHSYARGAEVPKNLVRNWRLGRLSLKHPRERLYRELPLLLNSHCYTHSNFSKRSKLFLSDWSRYN